MRKIILFIFIFFSILATVLFAELPLQRGPFPGQSGMPRSAPQGDNFKFDRKTAQGPRPEFYENNKADLSLAAKHINSPFGFANTWATDSTPMYNYPDYINNLKDLGVYWVRVAGFYSLNWNWSRMRSMDGRWNNLDAIVKELQFNSINPLMGINLGPEETPDMDEKRRPGRGGMEGRKGRRPGDKLPSDLEAYSRFIQSAVERYDMDGAEDMPGLRFPVEYYMIGNEPDVPVFWADTPENYAVLVRTTYLAIKRAFPEAKVVVGGSAGSLYEYLRAGQYPPKGLNTSLRADSRKGDGFFVDFLRHLRKISGQEDYRDLIMDFHFYGNAGDWRVIEYFVRYIRNIEDDLGFAHFSVWVTETGTFSGKISGMVKNDLARITGQMGKTLSQDEAAQAGELVKRYIFGAVNGVEKLFWFTIKGGSNPIYFENTGILDSHSGKKLSYYAYKKMVEILEGSDWKNIQTIQKDGAYIFKFLKSGKPVWVAWSEERGLKEATISGIPSKQAKITRLGQYGSGKDVASYEGAFRIEVRPVVNRQINIELGDSPQFIEAR